MRIAIACAVLALAACQAVPAQCRLASTRPAATATRPATATTMPMATTRPTATTRPATATTSTTAVDPAVLKILADQQAAGRKYPTIRAELTMRVVDRRVGDSEQRTGWVAYRKADSTGPAKFRVHFDTLQQGKGPKRREELDWAFDGRWLSKAQPRIRQIHRFQVVADGAKAEPMKLGTGPLPLPFGQRTDEVLKYYHATTRPPTKGDPANSVYLKLTARKEHFRDLDAIRLEMWLDNKTHLPVKIVATDKRRKVTTVTFKNIETNVKFDAAKMFELPLRLGWTEDRRPLEN